MKQPVLLYSPEIAAQFISEFEQGPKGGPALESYLCPAKVWTIGFGHTKGVRKGDRITRTKAWKLLAKDLIQTQEELAALVKVEFSQNQFVALMSWLFNPGLTPDVRRSTLIKKNQCQRL